MGKSTIADKTIIGEPGKKRRILPIGADSVGSKIILRDAAGNEFKTSNPAVITAMIEEMKWSPNAKLREVESQISF